MPGGQYLGEPNYYRPPPGWSPHHGGGGGYPRFAQPPAPPSAPDSGDAIQGINDLRQVQYPPGMEPPAGAPVGAPSNYNPMVGGNQGTAQALAQNQQPQMNFNPLLMRMLMQSYGGGGMMNPMLGMRGRFGDYRF